MKIFLSLDRVENTVEKKKKCWLPAFSPLLQCFLEFFSPGISKLKIKLVKPFPNDKF